jgi:2-C-methyl-D-erythritol 4-phosphate cytidylyltransferase
VGKVNACITGGATRAESVRAAVAEIPPDATVILVHDAARPLVSSEVIERVLRPLSEGWDGAVPALPLADTVKRVRGVEVVETLERDDLRAVQTPQAFVADSLRTALGSDVGGATDCAALVEATNGRVCVVEGDPRLLKITSPADLELVASWL